jgi:hypothetical protein
LRGGRNLKAVVPGGSSTPVLLPEEIDIGMDFDQVGKAGSMLGSGGVVVIDDQTCIVEFALRTISFYQHESCGWCIPCREGTDWLKKSLKRFHAGFGEAKDIDNMHYLAENMLGRTFCPLGDAEREPPCPPSRSCKKFRKELRRGKLGNAYYKGQGVPQDYPEAYFWLDLASAGKLDDSDTEQAVARIRDKVASYMTPADLSSEQERARKWFEAHQVKTK